MSWNNLLASVATSLLLEEKGGTAGYWQGPSGPVEENTKYISKTLGLVASTYWIVERLRSE